jgi:hypothetical protein
MTDDTTARSETKYYSVGSKYDGGEVLGLSVDGLKVYLLSTTARKHGAELEPYEEATETKRETEDPEHEGGAD